MRAEIFRMPFRWAGYILDFLIPPECSLCGDPLPYGEDFLCEGCRAMLPRTAFHMIPHNAMAARFEGKVPFERASAHFFYTPNSSIASLIHDFKYRKRPSLALYLGKLIGQELLFTDYLEGIDFILPIPLHWTKRIRRGYNQTEYIAAGIASHSGVEVSKDLKACRPHRTQTSFDHASRMKNVIDIFELHNPERYAGKHLLLLDDVCTTGSTLVSAADTVIAVISRLRLPAPRISLFTLACTTT